MTIRNVSAPEKKAIISSLEKSISAYGFEKVKTTINHYFKNNHERSKALKRIEELKKELAQLEKKK